MICVYCSRILARVDGYWIDPEATGDDSFWREACEANHETFRAEHAPVPGGWHPTMTEPCGDRDCPYPHPGDSAPPAPNDDERPGGAT